LFPAWAERSPLLRILLLALALSSPDPRLPFRPPGEVGMSAARLAAIDRIVNKGISGGGFPGAAVVVGRGGFVVYERGFGRVTWNTPSRAVVPNETIYDVASLTKVVATTTAVMILFDRGKIALDAPVQRYLPEFRGARKEKVTVRQLLTHHSGLPAGLVLWRTKLTPAQARTRVLETPLRPWCPPGSCFEYSDLGADVLGFLVEKVSGERLDVFVARHVFEPLQMTHSMFKPGAPVRPHIAPTAHASRRGYALHGEVHDDNAHAMGGIVGHAGLFSSASDLAVFAQMMLNRGTINGVRIVADSTVTIFTAEQRDSRALGWEIADSVHGAGDHLSERAYGHTGFTGTSLWIDPERQMYIVLLTNRVYAPRARWSDDVISNVRNDLADAAALSITNDALFPTRTMPVAFRSDTASTWNARYRVPSKRAK
jgi:CubicO group peptidase (beta-lactamase class C family)